MTNNKKKTRKNLKILNKSFVEKKINKNEPNLMEAAMNIKRFELERSSTPNSINICEHCNHNHAQECCMYYHDSFSDIIKYSNFKQSVDENYWTMEKSEDFGLKIFSTTRPGFPAYTKNIPAVEQKMLENQKPPPVVYLRQYLWPIFLPPVYQAPIQNIQYYQNPQYLPPIVYGPAPIPHHQPYMPLIMRQVPLPIQPSSQTAFQYGYPPNYQRVIEAHNYIPVNYYTAGINGGNWA